MDDLRAFLQGRPLRLATWMVVAGALLHLALAASTGLTPDEAHYALYGAHPDWSYFDHPALVGWLQAPFASAQGTDLQMRIVPMASWVATAALLVVLRRRLAAPHGGGRWDDLWCVTLLVVTPLLNLLGVVLVPDSLLMPLVPAAMLATWSLRSSEAAQDWRRWAVLALVLGLSLLAKYTGLFVVLGALASLWSFHGSRLPRLPGAWMAAGIVLLLASPIVVWNGQHHWISFAYQSDHAAGDQPWHAVSTLRAALLQLLLFGVLLPACVVRACRGVSAPSTSARDARRMGLLFGVPVLVVFLVLAGRGSSLPHWTVCGWVALIPLAVTGLRSLGRRWLVGMLAWQGALLAAIVGLVATGGPMSETGAAAVSAAGARGPSAHPNPVADLYGWDAAAAHAAREARRTGARGIVVMNWSLASRLAWYARPLPIFVAPPRQDQFQIWFGSLRRGDSVIAVDWSGMPLQIPMGTAGFAGCEPIDQLPTMANGKQLAHFNFLHCHGWGEAGMMSASAR